jgi:hypothetical protein
MPFAARSVMVNTPVGSDLGVWYPFRTHRDRRFLSSSTGPRRGWVSEGRLRRERNHGGAFFRINGGKAV